MTEFRFTRPEQYHHDRTDSQELSSRQGHYRVAETLQEAIKQIRSENGFVNKDLDVQLWGDGSGSVRGLYLGRIHFSNNKPPFTLYLPKEKEAVKQNG